MHIRQVSTPAMLLILCAVAGCTSLVRSNAPPSKTYVTGSLLSVPVDPRTGLPQADPSLQVVTHEQIELSGRTDLGAALRQLVPAIQ